MAMCAKVRRMRMRMRMREGLSIIEIARRTSLSRNTIKRWLGEPLRKEIRCERQVGGKNLDAHAEWLGKALQTDALRPRKERRTALRLLEQLKELGYSGPTTQSRTRASSATSDNSDFATKCCSD